MLLIYKSSAGSGKTYTLVKEYLRLALAHPTKYKNILAITFTNKAAAEMKTRILEALKGISEAQEDYATLQHDLAQATGNTAPQLRQLAGTILQSMLHNYADISVSTIDSFVHRIVRSFAHDLNLSMNFDIEMDEKKLLQDAVDLLLDRLDESDTQITQAVIDFAEAKIEEGKSWNVEFGISKLGEQLFKDDTLPYLQQLSLVKVAEMRSAKAALNNQMKLFESRLSKAGQSAIDFIASNNLTADDFYQKKKGIFGFFQKYAEGDFPNDLLGNTYVTTCMKEDDWGKKDKLDKYVKDTLRDHYHNITTLWQHDGKDYYLADLLLKNFYAFILLADLQKLIDEIKRSNNILHIGDFQQRVFEIVKEQDAPVIYERIGEKYDHILIDEFQDTSVIQWRNLLPLIENTQFKNEDNLIVGDGKQAIYRFRGGEVEQFSMLPKIYGSDTDELLKFRETAIINHEYKLEPLAKNYRSSREIIDFNNALYKEMLQLPELKNKEIYADYFQEPGKDKAGGFVNIQFLKPDATTGATIEEVRNAKVEEIITDVLTRGYQWKDIAILTRNNKVASALAAYLVQRKIRVVSSESLLIHQSPKVQLLLAVFNYLNQKDNHIARAEIFYYTRLLHAQPAQFEQIQFDTPFTLFENTYRQLTGVELYSDKLLTGRLADLVQQLIQLFRLNDEDPFLQFFLDEVLLFTSRYGNSIAEFITWWESVKDKKSIIYPESMNAVRVMTIHKSKGLQFPVVILADAVETQEATKKFFWVPLQKPYLPQFHIGLVPVQKQLTETEFANLYEHEMDQSFLDMLNLLYVGTTRPEDALYILSKELSEVPEKNNTVTGLLISFLQNVNQWEGFQQYVFGSPDYMKQISSKNTKPKLEDYQKSATQAKDQLLSSINIKMRGNLLWSDATNEKIDAGNILHQALSWIKHEGDEIKAAQKMAAEAVLSTDEQNLLLDKIRKVVYHPQLNHLFKHDVMAITERALLKHELGAKIPDRLVIQHGEVTIVDYKTGSPLPKHHLQLQEYANCLEETGLKVKEKILYYSTTNTVTIV